MFRPTHALPVLLVAAGCASASVPRTAPSTAGTFIAISVADVEATSRWYQEKLDFQVVKAGEAPNRIARFALLRQGDHVLELIQHSEAKPPPGEAPVRQAHRTHGFFKVGFVVEDIDARHRELGRRGVPMAYELMNAKDLPLRTFSVRDNEGNLLQFFGK
ncbi:MAG TPA: VOC family protein [Myxococcales bacterium]|nr:VOC family protein [Myxococcales bacterium]